MCIYKAKKKKEIRKLAFMSDKKTPKEASQLFHNIIKASVSPKATGAAKKKAVKPAPKTEGGNAGERNG